MAYWSSAPLQRRKDGRPQGENGNLADKSDWRFFFFFFFLSQPRSRYSELAKIETLRSSLVLLLTSHLLHQLLFLDLLLFISIIAQ